MYLDKTLFAQLMGFLPWKTFHRIVDRCDGDRYVKSLTCAEQFRVMAFAQLTCRDSASERKQALTVTWFALTPFRYNHATKGLSRR